MTKETTITCDRCNADLMYTNYSSEYRIVLYDAPKYNKGGACYAMDIPPHIGGEKHFCNFQCLKQWVNQ